MASYEGEEEEEGWWSSVEVDDGEKSRSRRRRVSVEEMLERIGVDVEVICQGRFDAEEDGDREGEDERYVCVLDLVQEDEEEFGGGGCVEDVVRRGRELVGAIERSSGVERERERERSGKGMEGRVSPSRLPRFSGRTTRKEENWRTREDVPPTPAPLSLRRTSGIPVPLSGSRRSVAPLPGYSCTRYPSDEGGWRKEEASRWKPQVAKVGGGGGWR